MNLSPLPQCLLVHRRCLSRRIDGRPILLGILRFECIVLRRSEPRAQSKSQFLEIFVNSAQTRQARKSSEQQLRPSTRSPESRNTNFQFSSVPLLLPRNSDSTFRTLMLLLPEEVALTRLSLAERVVGCSRSWCRPRQQQQQQAAIKRADTRNMGQIFLKLLSLPINLLSVHARGAVFVARWWL